MTLGDAIADALPRLRAQAESMMDDTVVVERPTGKSAPDPVTLKQVPTFVAVYEGKARIQRPNSSTAQEVVAGGEEFGLSAVTAQLPFSAVGIKKGHRLRVTAVGPLTDPDLLGLVATVQANRTKTHATKRTLICEEVT